MPIDPSCDYCPLHPFDVTENSLLRAIAKGMLRLLACIKHGGRSNHSSTDHKEVSHKEVLYE